MGVRIGSLSYNLAEAVVALANNEPLSSLDFSEVTITGTDGAESGRQAVGSSGLKAYTRLPVFNGVDLETFCPGEATSDSVFITDDPPANLAPEPQNVPTDNSDDDDFPVWAIVLIVVLSVAALGSIAFIGYIVQKERQGNPMFKALVQEEGAPAAGQYTSGRQV